MNTRVLELIKNPKIITESDLNILESESEKMPYAQSIRALYLYGINLYRTGNYKENLSKTAAYTTDKKILYHFINSQKIQKIDESLVQKIIDETTHSLVINEKVTAGDLIGKTLETPEDLENTSVVLNKFDIDKIIETESAQNSEYIVVDGEKNRLLYEGEENFLEEKSQEIDLEATKESGVITVKDDLEIKENLIINDENRSEETISEHINVEEVMETPTEKVSEMMNVETQVQDEDSSGNISFNGIEDFLPQVKFSVPKNHLDYLNPPKKEAKKELISEEKTIGRSEYQEPKIKEITENEMDPSQVSFGETQAFEVSKSDISNEPERRDLNQILEENTKDQINFDKTQTFEASKPEKPLAEIPILQSDHSKIEETEAEQTISAWKPMSFSTNTPDALIGKAKEFEQPKQEIVVEENAKIPVIVDEISIDEELTEVEKPQIPETERPVMNVSFFGNQVSKVEEKEKEIPPILDKVIEQDLEQSNVGTFINTWQNWLKIDRPKDAEPVEKTIVVKEKIIDQFIEKNPRISQLKDEVNFVVKEKKDDISHLMTETLAKLYVEQKLYSKAIKAYETLSEKHPQKADYFKEKIEEVKEIRKS